MGECQLKNKIYKEAIISFVDIIGFRNLVDKDETGKEILEILKIFSMMSGVNNKVLGTQPAVFNLSDSVVRIRDIKTVKENYIEELFATEIMILINIQRRMIENGILIRGGTTQGNIYFDDNHIFGPGFNDAYSLEKEKAKYPRIVISDEITDKYKNYREFNIAFKKDGSDNIWFIDYLSHILYIDESTKQSNELFLIKHKQTIEENYKRLMKSEDNNSKDKYEWLVNYHNERVNNLKLNSDYKVILN
jgi:hypothetical protein